MDSDNSHVQSRDATRRDETRRDETRRDETSIGDRRATLSVRTFGFLVGVFFWCVFSFSFSFFFQSGDHTL